VKKTHAYLHCYRGYWSHGGKCRIRIYQEEGRAPVVICSQLPDNDNTSVTNMAEFLAAEVIEKQELPTPLAWVEHYPEHEGEIEEYSLVWFSSWELDEVHLGGVWRYRIGSPRWSPLSPQKVEALLASGSPSGAQDGVKIPYMDSRSAGRPDRDALRGDLWLKQVRDASL
jgi:hypothetical protein